MAKPFISVIIAAYNEEAYLATCLKTLVPQLEENDEIIVVDNNSSDKTVVIAQTFGARVIHEKQQGMSFARNAGFNAAKNNILARTDADTVVSSGWLNSIRKHYDATQKLNAITGPVYLKEFLPLKYGLHQGFTKKTLGHETLVGSNEALTKDLWLIIQNKLSNDDANYMEDMEMANSIITCGGHIEFLPAMTVYTSGRWMIRRPLNSLATWRRKLKSTKNLLGLQ